jgi:hypothetical protein
MNMTTGKNTKKKSSKATTKKNPKAKSTTTPKTAQAKQTAGRGGCLDAAAKLLKDKGEPMRCKDLVETMLAKGLWKTEGKTPAATLYSAILREIQTKKSASRFRKTDRGLFAAA